MRYFADFLDILETPSLLHIGLRYFIHIALLHHRGLLPPFFRCRSDQKIFLVQLRGFGVAVAFEMYI